MFKQYVSKLANLIINQSVITDAGVVPGTNNSQLFIVLNAAAILFTNISSLLNEQRSVNAAKEQTSFFIFHQFRPICFAMMFVGGKMISVDHSGRLMFNQVDQHNITPLSSNVTFSNKIINLQQLPSSKIMTNFALS